MVNFSLGEKRIVNHQRIVKNTRTPEAGRYLRVPDNLCYVMSSSLAKAIPFLNKYLFVNCMYTCMSMYTYAYECSAHRS